MICDVSSNEDRQCYMLYTESNILGLKCRYYTASLKAFLYLPICCQSGATKKGRLQRLTVDYNDSMKLLLKAAGNSSTSQMFANVGMLTCSAVIRNLSFRYMQRLSESANNILP